MYRNVLVPLDGSPLAEQALLAAVSICRRTAARLHLVHVRTYRPPAEARDVDPARAYLGAACERVCDEIGESVSFAVLPEKEPALLLPSPSPGTVAELVEGYARANRVDLIVMATHGRGGLSRLWFGSVADAILRTCVRPVLVVRPEEGGAPQRWRGAHPFTHVLVPTDGSEPSRAALGPARAIGGIFDARYTLLRVVLPPMPIVDGLTPVPVVFGPDDEAAVQAAAERDLARDADVLRAGGAAVTTAIVFDPSVPNAILRVARDRDVDLIVLATNARSGLDRILVGSVADKVIRAADCPVLVIRASRAETSVPAAAAEAPEKGAADD